jgi:hypothetical protein
LLKLDIEGAEEQMLENGAFLARTDHIIVELHGDYGFECFRRDIAPYGLVAQEGRPPDTLWSGVRKRLVRAGIFYALQRMVAKSIFSMVLEAKLRDRASIPAAECSEQK